MLVRDIRGEGAKHTRSGVGCRVLLLLEREFGSNVWDGGIPRDEQVDARGEATVAVCQTIVTASQAWMCRCEPRGQE